MVSYAVMCNDFTSVNEDLKLPLSVREFKIGASIARTC